MLDWPLAGKHNGVPGFCSAAKTSEIEERGLVLTPGRYATIDWNLRESVRAKQRSLVRRLLRKYTDLQEKATETVLKQAELLATELAA